MRCVSCTISLVWAYDWVVNWKRVERKTCACFEHCGCGWCLGKWKRKVLGNHLETHLGLSFGKLHELYAYLIIASQVERWFNLVSMLSNHIYVSGSKQFYTCKLKDHQMHRNEKIFQQSTSSPKKRKYINIIWQRRCSNNNWNKLIMVQ